MNKLLLDDKQSQHNLHQCQYVGQCYNRAQWSLCKLGNKEAVKSSFMFVVKFLKFDIKNCTHNKFKHTDILWVRYISCNVMNSHQIKEFAYRSQNGVSSSTNSIGSPTACVDEESYRYVAAAPDRPGAAAWWMSEQPKPVSTSIANSICPNYIRATGDDDATKAAISVCSHSIFSTARRSL